MATVASASSSAPWHHPQTAVDGSYQHSRGHSHQRQASSSSTSTVSSQQQSASMRRSSRSSSHQADTFDRFYGHRELAELCERVILALFACPLDSAASSDASSSPTSHKAAPRLSEFIAYALHRTRLPLAVTHQALYLLRRLKCRFPAARGSSGHRLFISALMLASKSSCDDTYSNKSWTIVGQGLFSLREVNQMERELFGYLSFRVNVEPEDLDEFVAGLEQGRLDAVIESTSPTLECEPAAASLPSPPSISEPCFAGPSASPASYTRPARLRENTSASTDQAHSSRFARHIQHPHTSAAAFNRASIAGYPSLMSAQQRSMSLSMPVTASASDSSLHRTGRTYSSNGAPVVANPDASMYISDTPSSSRSSYMASLAAPSVPMQGYYPSPSAASTSSYCSNTSTGNYLADPYAAHGSGSHSSSSSTTPETASSGFDSPDDSGDEEEELGASSIYEEEDPAHVYDGERLSSYPKQDHMQGHYQQFAGHNGPVFSPNYSMAASAHQKAAEYRYHESQHTQRQRLAAPQPDPFNPHWS